MELSKYELAAVKRVELSCRPVIRKVNTLQNHIAKLQGEIKELVGEYEAIQSYVKGKYGKYSCEILGTECPVLPYLNEEAVPAPTVEDMPAEEATEDVPMDIPDQVVENTEPESLPEPDPEVVVENIPSMENSAPSFDEAMNEFNEADNSSYEDPFAEEEGEEL